LSPGAYALAAGDGVMNDAKIVNTNVGKLRAACYFADGLNARRGGLETFIRLDVSRACCLDAG